MDTMVFLSAPYIFTCCMFIWQRNKNKNRNLQGKTLKAYIENLITIQQQVSNHLLLFHLFSYKYQCKKWYLQNEKESNIWLKSKKKQEKNLSLISSAPLSGNENLKSKPLMPTIFGLNLSDIICQGLWTFRK